MIESIEYYPYKIPMRNRFTTAHSSLPVREGALVAIRGEGGFVGFGDIAPLAGFGCETLADTLQAFPEVVARMHAMSIGEALAFLWQHGSAYPSSLVSGLELALLDVEGQARSRSISQLLLEYSGLAGTYAARERVRVNAVVGAPTLQAVLEEAQLAVAKGFGCIKLKVWQDEAAVIEWVAAVRQAIGPEVRLRLDANEGWSLEKAKVILHACTAFDIQYVEQPLARYDIDGVAALRRAVTVPIAADETVSDLTSARRVMQHEAADVLIVKPQFTHGLRVAQQIIIEAAEQGVQCVVTSALESGVGVAAALHLVAASPPVTLECGLATLPLLEDDLLVEPLPIEHGSMRVPDGAGLGFHIDMKALERYTDQAKIS